MSLRLSVSLSLSLSFNHLISKFYKLLSPRSRNELFIHDCSRLAADALSQQQQLLQFLMQQHQQSQLPQPQPQTPAAATPQTMSPSPSVKQETNDAQALIEQLQMQFKEVENTSPDDYSLIGLITPKFQP